MIPLPRPGMPYGACEACGGAPCECIAEPCDLAPPVTDQIELDRQAHAGGPRIATKGRQQ